MPSIAIIDSTSLIESFDLWNLPLEGVIVPQRPRALSLLAKDLTTPTSGNTAPIPGLALATSLAVTARLNYGSGGTTVQAWVQTSLDGGRTWCDIMSFAFTTVAATKISLVHLATALAAAVTPTNGTLADNTILNGLLGDQLRVRFSTTGTYVSTQLLLDAVLH